MCRTSAIIEGGPREGYVGKLYRAGISQLPSTQHPSRADIRQPWNTTFATSRMCWTSSIIEGESRGGRQVMGEEWCGILGIECEGHGHFIYASVGSPLAGVTIPVSADSLMNIGGRESDRKSSMLAFMYWKLWRVSAVSSERGTGFYKRNFMKRVSQLICPRVVLYFTA
jgi:hypothetical protein